MSHCLRWSALLAVVVLMSVSSALAANELAPPAGNFQLTLRTSGTVRATALQSTTAATVGRPILQLRPMTLNRAPIDARTTLLAAAPDTLSLQTPERRANNVANRHVQWAIYGAAIGAIVGAIDSDPLEKAAIGAVVGFGLSYVVRR